MFPPLAKQSALARNPVDWHAFLYEVKKWAVLPIHAVCAFLFIVLFWLKNSGIIFLSPNDEENIKAKTLTLTILCKSPLLRSSP